LRRRFYFTLVKVYTVFIEGLYWGELQSHWERESKAIGPQLAKVTSQVPSPGVRWTACCERSTRVVRYS